MFNEKRFLDVHLGPCETSMMELFRETSKRLKLADYICKMTSLKILDWIINTLLTV